MMLTTTTVNRSVPASLTVWAASGACRDSDPELFFPVTETGAAARQLARAKAVCAGCPVRDQCLQFALDSGQAFGVWGGTTGEERRLLRRRHSYRRRTAEAQPPGRTPDRAGHASRPHPKRRRAR
jgi:WhiB family transcriptional regulator, redox-sensing transcriptional regulator